MGSYAPRLPFSSHLQESAIRYDAFPLGGGVARRPVMADAFADVLRKAATNPSSQRTFQVALKYANMDER